MSNSRRAARGCWYLVRRRRFLAAVALQASPDQPDRRASPLRTSETVQRREPEGVPSLLRPFAASWQLLRPLLTSHAVSPRRPFSHKVRSPQVRTRSFPAQPPDLRRLRLDHESFAVCRPLALLGNASYPVLVHRLAVSLHASSPRSVALTQLRFASFAVVNSREDVHLQDRAHAGRTTETPAQGRGRGAALAGRILRR